MNEQSSEARVKAKYGAGVYACDYGSSRWVIVYLPFEPDNVGAEKLGFGDSEAEAWDDAASRLPPTPAIEGEPDELKVLRNMQGRLPATQPAYPSCPVCGAYHGPPDGSVSMGGAGMSATPRDLSERQKLMSVVELCLRRRIHFIEKHNQYFFRCESAWCNPGDCPHGSPEAEFCDICKSAGAGMRIEEVPDSATQPTLFQCLPCAGTGSVEREKRIKAEAAIERLTDLVRHQRHELWETKLISQDEFTALVQDTDNGRRVARLETYDEMRSAVEQMKTEHALAESALAMVREMDATIPTDWNTDLGLSRVGAYMEWLIAEVARMQTQLADANYKIDAALRGSEGK